MPKKKEKPKEKKPKKTTSTSSTDAKINELIGQYGPMLEQLGIGPTQLQVYVQLPKILDGMATAIGAMQGQIDQLMQAAASGAPRPAAAAPPSTAGSNPAGGLGGFLQGFLRSPDGQKFATELVKAFGGTGGGETGARSSTIKIAKAIEDSVLKQAVDNITKAFKLSGKEDFMKKLEEK